MQFLKVGKENSANILLHYEDYGKGQPVILIHGWPLSGKSWEKQIPALLNIGYRTIIYDRRGFGNSSKPSKGYDYDTLAKDLNILITKLNLNKVILVGFSMGGGEIARYIANFGSRRISKVVFIAAVTPFLLRTLDNPTGIDVAKFEEIKNSIVSDRFAFLSSFFKMFYNLDSLEGKLISSQAVQYSWNVAAAASPIATLECALSWSSTDFRKDLAKIKVPALIIHGTADQTVPFEISGKLTSEAIKPSKLALIQDAPHGLIWTHADNVNSELLDFLAK
ncbi:MAG: alpha/beta hydrolase [Phycisphaerales bacterium]